MLMHWARRVTIRFRWEGCISTGLTSCTVSLVDTSVITVRIILAVRTVLIMGCYTARPVRRGLVWNSQAVGNLRTRSTMSMSCSLLSISSTTRG